MLSPRGGAGCHGPPSVSLPLCTPPGVRLCVCLCVRAHTYTCMWVDVCTCMFVCVHACLCVCVWDGTPGGLSRVACPALQTWFPGKLAELRGCSCHLGKTKSHRQSSPNDTHHSIPTPAPRNCRWCSAPPPPPRSAPVSGDFPTMSERPCFPRS